MFQQLREGFKVPNPKLQVRFDQSCVRDIEVFCWSVEAMIDAVGEMNLAFDPARWSRGHVTVQSAPELEGRISRSRVLPTSSFAIARYHVVSLDDPTPSLLSGPQMPGRFYVSHPVVIRRYFPYYQPDLQLKCRNS